MLKKECSKWRSPLIRSGPTRFVPIRLFSCVLLLMGCASAQVAPAPLPLVAANGSAGPNTISPNPASVNVAGARALPDLPPQPKGKTTLLGGRIHTVDLVRDRLVLDVFGGGHMTVLFDERTHVYRGTAQGSMDQLAKGERAYVDTTLDGKDIFARNIRIVPEAATGQGNGQIEDFDFTKGEFTLRDTLSPKPVRMKLAAGAVIRRGDQTVSTAALEPGTLVSVVFVPGTEREPKVREVSILASPGATFGFSGRVSYLDLNRGLVVLVDPRDNKSYEVYVDATNRELTRDIQEGADISVEARFDGTHYEARRVTVNAGGNK